jgi:ribosomal-protein-alanine N-acetyltransferase
MPPASAWSFGPTPTLSTTRLTLEPLHREHASALFNGLSDPALYRYLSDTPPADLASIAERIARIAGGQSPGAADLWCDWMIRRNTDGRLVGTVQATLEADMPDVALIGIIVFPPFWHQRIGTDALACLLDCLFGHYGCRAAEARIDTRNFWSLALFTGQGFVTTALLPDVDFFAGQTSDEFTLSLDRTGWHGRRTAGPTPWPR